MGSRNVIFFLVGTLLLSSIAVGADDSQKRHDLDTLLAKARVANLRSNGSPSFHLRLDVHAEHVTAKPMDGSYEEIWIAPNAWRREISFPEFKQVEVGDEDGRWLDRSLDFRPHVVYLVAQSLDFVTVPPLQPNEQVTKFRKDKRDGAELQCAEIGTGRAHRTLCFDELGRLFSVENGDLRMEYRDYQKFGDATFPRKFSVYVNRERALEINVAELTAPSVKLAQLPHRSVSAFQLAMCDRWVPGTPMNRVAPRYPEEARRAHVQGTVLMYALLSADGALKKVRVLQSAGATLDQAATEAVAQWTYSPTDCGTGRALPAEIEVQVNFALSY